jgi:hypothetical protein
MGLVGDRRNVPFCHADMDVRNGIAAVLTFPVPADNFLPILAALNIVLICERLDLVLAAKGRVFNDHVALNKKQVVRRLVQRTGVLREREGVFRVRLRMGVRDDVRVCNATERFRQVSGVAPVCFTRSVYGR